MKICVTCGAQMPDEALVCSNCGTPLQASQIPQQPSQQDFQQPYPQQDFQQPYAQQPYQQAGYQQPYQQMGYQQPYQPMYNGNATNGKAIASLVLGIFSIITSSFVIGMVFGIIGCVLGVKARNEIPEGAPGRGIATGGVVCSIIGAILGGIVLLTCICAVGIGGCAAYMENMCILGGLI
ncbi:MAG: DUF4190 domain-containing protein [Clostridia bacterium]|nr:DUF4190 domain-containing protein [Clostridia bacterium]